MPLWEKTDADESKPKCSLTNRKKKYAANESGWVVENGSKMTGNDNPNTGPLRFYAV